MVGAFVRLRGLVWCPRAATAGAPALFQEAHRRSTLPHEQNEHKRDAEGNESAVANEPVAHDKVGEDLLGGGVVVEDADEAVECGCGGTDSGVSGGGRQQYMLLEQSAASMAGACALPLLVGTQRRRP